MPFDVISKVALTGYAPPSAIGLDLSNNQIYVSGSSLMWEPVGGGISIPVQVADGGTGATTPAGARSNLSAAQNAVNSDITSLQAVAASGDAGSQVGINITGTTGSNILAIQVNNGTIYSSWQANGLISCAGVNTNGNVLCGGIQVSGTAEIGTIASGVPGSGVSVGMFSPAYGTPVLNVTGSGVFGEAILGFTSYPGQTTVGSAGTASAPPSNPVVWAPVNWNGTVLVMPLYKQS